LILNCKLSFFALICFAFSILLPDEVLASGDVQFVSHSKPEFQYDLTYYRIHWNINPNVYAISGSVTSYFRPLGGTTFSSIGFDFSSLLFADSIFYHGKKIKYSSNQENELLIGLPGTVSPNTMDSISIYYHGVPFDDGESFHQDIHDGVPIITTLSQPYGALLWWPCKQDLTTKADSIDTYTTVPFGNLVGSNGLLVDTVREGNYITFHWKERYPIATYLVGVAVTNYAQFTQYAKTSLGDSFPVLYYVYPENFGSWKAQSLETLKMLHLYDSLYGPYPFRKEKYGHAEWNWGGGMEHQTMSFVVDLSFHVVCHEMAHQWFGDKITCGSWKDIWLNEGFATLNEGISLEFLQGDSAYYEWMQSELLTAQGAPHGSVYATDTVDVNEIFNDQLSYVKAGFVLRTLRYMLGDSVFFAGVRSYISDTALGYRFANTDDIEYHLEKASGKDLSKFFNDWIYLQGYPFFNVKWQQKANIVTVNIVQTPTDPSVSFFDLPLDMKLNFTNSDSAILIHPTTNDTTFYINTGRTLKSLVFDPGIWFLSNSKVDISDSIFSPVEIYPNPATNYITVDFSSQSISIGGIVTLTNAAGKIIYSAPTSGLPYVQINTSRLAPGVYIVNFVSPLDKYTQEIIKMGEGY